MSKIIKNNKGGTIILLTMLVLAGIFTISLSMGDIVVNGLKASKNQVYSSLAYYGAESLAERVLWQIRTNDINLENVCSPGNYYEFSGGLVDVSGALDLNCTADGSGNSIETLSNGVEFKLLRKPDVGLDIVLSCEGSYSAGGRTAKRVIQISY